MLKFGEGIRKTESSGNWFLFRLQVRGGKHLLRWVPQKELRGPVIEVSSFYNTQHSRCLLPLTWRRKRNQFPKCRVLFILIIPGGGQSPETVILNVIRGHAVTQVVSHRLPAPAARIRTRISSCGICSGQSGSGASLLRVLLFPLPIIPPTAPHPSSGARTIAK
jgi:hypothetical protein